MKTILKSIFAVGTSLGPLTAKEYLGQNWSLYWAVGYGFVVFVTSLIVFQPDRRFLNVREPTVNNYLRAALASAPENAIRANVYVKVIWWGWPYLVPVVCYKGNPAHPDYAKPWSWGRGLCWQVYKTGKFGLWRKDVDPADKYGMKRADIAETAHVLAVLCLPLKRKAGGEASKGVRRKVCGVLAYDALTPEGVEFLQQQHDRLVENTNRELLELVEAVSLYF